MRLLDKESKVEYAVVTWWKNRGGLQLKINVQGARGWPDRLFLAPGRPVFIEFKRVGEKGRPLQEYIHKQLQQRGYEVYVCDTYDDAIAILAAAPVSEGCS